MSTKPILFSGPMVKALLAGGKTQTRRVAKAKPGTMMDDLDWTDLPHGTRRGTLPLDKVGVPFAAGDRLYVREAWRTESRAYNDLSPAEMDADYPVIYEADADWSTNKSVGRFRQGMHMPRWASRLTLTVTEVRVQRLQEITVADAVAEGAIVGPVDQFAQVHAIKMYEAIWDGLNANRGFAWSTNPWVVAVSFDVVLGNLDAQPVSQ